MAPAVPELSVVIPCWNEERALPPLLEDLRRQRGVTLEVIAADGGSRDGSLEALQAVAARGDLALAVTSGGPPGRGRQMNRGAALARAPDVLFLHADSRLPDPRLLAEGRRCMEAQRRQRASVRVAGHYGVQFQRSRPGAAAGYYFYEAKSRLNRPDCVNGDQGMWLARAYFEELGGFDEGLPYMEDARFARRVFASGSWVTLPGTVVTSARRFETEGLRERQTLNALLCCFDAIGLRRFLAAAPGAYRAQAGAGRLELAPFRTLAHRLAWRAGVLGFADYWLRTGRYVAANAWQLAFAVDCGHNRRRGRAPGKGPTPWLDRHQRWGEPLVRSLPGVVAATLVTAAWFYTALALQRRSPRS